MVSLLLRDPRLSQLPAAACGHVIKGAGPSARPTDFNKVDVRAITAAAFPLGKPVRLLTLPVISLVLPGRLRWQVGTARSGLGARLRARCCVLRAGFTWSSGFFSRLASCVLRCSPAANTPCSALLKRCVGAFEPAPKLAR